MGDLVNVAFTGATYWGLRNSGKDFVDAILESDFKRGMYRTSILDYSLTVFPEVNGSETQIYIQHKGEIRLAEDVEDGPEIVAEELELLRKDENHVDFGVIAESLDEAILFATINNDEWNNIKLLPGLLASSFANGFDFLMNPEAEINTYCIDGLKLHRPIRRGANAIYVCQGSETVWYDSNSLEVQRLRDVPGCADSIEDALATYAGIE